MTKLDNSQISKVLGQTVDYPDQYDPSILVRELRSNNRQHLDIHEGKLPFVGFDTWNAYEASTLTVKGLPVAGAMKIVYPCDSKYIVESKSIKLYLNSFNMFRHGDTRENAIESMENTVSNDLSTLLETEVNAKFLIDNPNKIEGPIFNNTLYPNIENFILRADELDSLTLDVYEETPELIKYQTGSERVQRFSSGLLKSNCRVTSQPDWGDIYVHILGEKTVDIPSMLKYIVSFRNECHFHEEICETVYKRLHDILQPKELCVTCLYARRGGIDINPSRANEPWLLPIPLADLNVPHCKTQKQ